MSERNQAIGDLMSTTLQRIKEMIDVDTIVGKPIVTPDGSTLIPVSQLSLGFAAGGSTFSGKAAEGNFGGGSGAGVKIEPVAFLVVRDGSVRLLPVGMPPMNTVDRLIDMAPEVVDKVTGYLDSRRAEKDKSEF